MLQLLGILIVLNALVSAIWWSVTSRSWNVSLGALVATALVIGMALIFNQRLIEMAMADAASLRASQKRAEADADAIATFRRQAEENSATIEVIAKESAETKRLLAELRGEKRLAEPVSAPPQPPPVGPAKTADPSPNGSAEIKPPAGEPMPAKETADEKPTVVATDGHFDGRLHIGSKVSDQAHAMKQQFDRAVALSKEKHYKQAYTSAKECVAHYEAMEKAGKGARGDSTEVTADGAGAIYSVAGELAQRAGDHAQALEWAKKAVDYYPSPERKALLTTAYLNLHQREAADRIIHEAMTEYDPDSIRLRDLLTEFGVIKAPKP